MTAYNDYLAAVRDFERVANPSEVAAKGWSAEMERASRALTDARDRLHEGREDKR